MLEDNDRDKRQGQTIGEISRAKREQAEEAIARLAAIVQSTDDAIIGKTLEGIITSWNDGAVRLYDYPADEVIGKSVSILAPAGMPDEVLDILNRIKRGEKVDHFETVRQKKDGQHIDISLTVSPIKDKKGNIVGASTITRDITKRKKIEASLEKARKDMEAFAYSVSHDLRAPLRSIDGFSQVLLEDYNDKLDASGKNYLQRIRAAAQRMGELIDDLLMLSRVTSYEMKHEKVDLSALAGEVTNELRKAQPERLVTSVIASGLTVNGDANLLRIVLTNLMDNAWKFTGKHPTARIEFGATQKDGETVYFVRDDGVGFDMKYADKLFAPFQRLHTVSEFPGTGIGLVIVQRIVHRHDGKIWVESEVEKGATFYFTLG